MRVGIALVSSLVTLLKKLNSNAEWELPAGRGTTNVFFTDDDLASLKHEVPL
jgi:hypothetical protein